MGWACTHLGGVRGRNGVCVCVSVHLCACLLNRSKRKIQFSHWYYQLGRQLSSCLGRLSAKLKSIVFTMYGWLAGMHAVCLCLWALWARLHDSCVPPPLSNPTVHHHGLLKRPTNIISIHYGHLRDADACQLLHSSLAAWMPVCSRNTLPLREFSSLPQISVRRHL